MSKNEAARKPMDTIERAQYALKELWHVKRLYPMPELQNIYDNLTRAIIELDHEIESAKTHTQ